MSHIFDIFLQGLLIAAGMVWKTGWSLVLEFAISAVLQVIVSADRLKDWLGHDGAKSVVVRGVPEQALPKPL